MLSGFELYPRWVPLKDAVAVNYESKSFTKKQIVWVSCGISNEGILVPGSTGVPANMAAQGG